MIIKKHHFPHKIVLVKTIQCFFAVSVSIQQKNSESVVMAAVIAQQVSFRQNDQRPSFYGDNSAAVF